MPTTWGLDMSTSPRKTAAVQLSWLDGGAQITDVQHPLKASEIVSLIEKHRDQTWAVDVPFGWPDNFVSLMADRHDGALPSASVPPDNEWETWRTQRVAQRRTDYFLTHDERIKVRPLPASFQLLGATAAMWTLLESRLVSMGLHVDRAGIKGTLCETYPRAAMAGWGYRIKSKADRRTLQRTFAFLTLEPRWDEKLASDDVCDAVVCALVARARDLCLTIPPRTTTSWPRPTRRLDSRHRHQASRTAGVTGNQMSLPTARSFAPLTDEHLARLSAIAAEDREQFYAKQPRYRGRHIATVIAQGGALHLIDGKNGVKDLDVWSFSALPAGDERFPADIRHRHIDFGPSTLGRQLYDFDHAKNKTERANWMKWSRFEGRRVDLFLRGLRCGADANPTEAITGWLRAGRGKKDSSPWWLSQKAVVLIDPLAGRRDIVWPPDRAGSLSGSRSR